MTAQWVGLLLAVFILMIWVGCPKPLKPGQERLIEGKEAPAWVESSKGGSTSKERVFVGRSDRCDDLQEAREEAQRDAYHKTSQAMVAYMDARLSLLGKDLLPTDTLRAELIRIGREGLPEGEVAEYFEQKYRKNEDGEKVDYYTAYCRYIVPRDAAHAFLVDLLQRMRAETKDAPRRARLDSALTKLNEMDDKGF